MNIKSILLGAAAAAAAVSGAQAADLPAAPEPVDYVRVCDAFGSSFFYLPGTETCLRVAGRVRTEFRVRNFGDDPFPFGSTGFQNRDQDGTTLRARGYVRLDARTQTEYGLLRNYTEIFVTQDTGSGASVTLDRAFIQFGGLTAGRTTSFFDFYVGDTFASVLDAGFSDATINLFGYTYSFGDGFSASVSVEDGVERRSGIAQLSSLGLPITTASSALADRYGGHRLPDFVANLRVDQGWGSAQIMGAIHQVWNNDATANTGAESEIGFAIGGGITYNLPFLAEGDTVSLQAVYANGASQYLSPTAVVDAVVNNAGNDLETVEGFQVGGGIFHNWSAHWNSSFNVSYVDFDVPFGDVYDHDQLFLQGNLVWEPVSGLLIGAEVEYIRTEFDDVDAEFDELEALLRIQRTF
ncbi:porin [Stappia sp. F7233]|uniref:Porin n=1 Tax=Stappia albiluteola TaxID=2758565 RepID=A0A839AES0_9HYPH|nr:porin [Stappia albiluteola]MBA5777635.1 porin [Stappia albiluteola]